MDYNLGELKFNLWFLRKIMESNILLGFVVLLLLLKIVLIGFSVNLPFNVFFADITKITLENLANQTRQSLGLGILASSLKLDQAARLKAEDMVKNQYFSHTSPTGVTPWFWFSQTDYNYKYAGENLAIGFFDSEEVYRAWLDSPSHKANLVNPNYREIGTAIASGFGQNKAVVVVQFFGKPKGTPVERIVLQDIEVGVKSETIDDTNLILRQESEVQEIELHVIQETDLFVSVKESSVEDIPDRKFKDSTDNSTSPVLILEFIIDSGLFTI